MSARQIRTKGKSAKSPFTPPSGPLSAKNRDRICKPGQSGKCFRKPDSLHLENGDHLTLEEFERRYAAMPHVKKAELVKGLVYMGSPVKNAHSEAHAALITWLGNYRIAVPGIRLNDNATVCLDKENEIQPDAMLRFDENTGGGSRVREDGYIEGSPELAVEVAASTSSYDLHEKMNIYLRNRVQEYIVWRIYEHKIDWFAYRKGKYSRIKPDADGIICSRIFPGLCLSVKDMVEGNLAKVMEELKKGMETEQYREFVKNMRKKTEQVREQG